MEAILKNEGVIEPDEENEDSFAEEDEEQEDDLQLVRVGEEESQKESDEENGISTIAVSTFLASTGTKFFSLTEGCLQEESEGDIPVSRNVRKSALKAKTKGKVGRPKKRRFICEYCGKSFLHSGHFAHHIRTRHGQSQLTCLTCNETFATKNDLTAHQKAEQHTGEVVSEVQHNMDDVDGDESNQVGILLLLVMK